MSIIRNSIVVILTSLGLFSASSRTLVAFAAEAEPAKADTRSNGAQAAIGDEGPGTLLTSDEQEHLNGELAKLQSEFTADEINALIFTLQNGKIDVLGKRGELIKTLKTGLDHPTSI
ncbi:hypothetical protein WDW86_07235 [Bdellovibrionota bacterium FG-2]